MKKRSRPKDEKVMGVTAPAIHLTMFGAAVISAGIATICGVIMLIFDLAF